MTSSLCRLLLAATTAALSGSCTLLVGFEQPLEQPAQCGDGVDNDGNGVSDCDDPACAGTAMCMAPASCGNGLPDPGEQCDDGNQTPNDGCEPETCLFSCGGEVPGAIARAFDPASGHCYLAFAGPEEAFAAHQFCTTLGGYIAVPDDAAEDALLRSIAPPSMTLGMVDDVADGEYAFTKVTGNQPATYLNFTSGQPDEPTNGPPICVAYDDTQPTWQDVPCLSAPRPFTCELHMNPCGDFVVQPQTETCDDGNTEPGDGCSATCQAEGSNVDECSLGLDDCSPDAMCIDTPPGPMGQPGFVCMCTGGFVGDGKTCVPVPSVPPLAPVASTKVSGALTGCTTATSEDAKRLAIDPVGVLYATFRCGNAVQLVVSKDAGASWSAPFEIAAGTDEATVVAVDVGRVAVVYRAGDTVFARQSFDFGATWRPVDLVSATAVDDGALAAYGDPGNFVVALDGSSGVELHRATDPSLTSFQLVGTLPGTQATLVRVPASNDLWAVSADPQLHFLRSTDVGASWPPPLHSLTASHVDADIALAGNRWLVAGAESTFSLFTLASPPEPAGGGDLPSVSGPHERAVDGFPDGTAYLVQRGGEGLALLRMPPASSQFEPSVGLDASGFSPGVLALPAGFAAVIYTHASGDVRVQIVGPPTGPPMAPTSCADILAFMPGAPSGAYLIDPDGELGPDLPFEVMCDMVTAGGGWTMVYKVSAGVADVDPFTLWDGGPVNESDVSLLVFGPSAASYANRIPTTLWNQGGFQVTAARTSVYLGQTLVFDVIFDAVGSDRQTWFDGTRLLMDPWADLPGATLDFFGIAGDSANGHRWFINQSSADCAMQAGWLVIDTAPSMCQWEADRGPPPSIVYNPTPTVQSWQTGIVQSGDAFVVWVR